MRVIMPRAMAALRRMARRWRDTARIPEVFEQDIEDALKRIALEPTSAPVARRTARRTVYRVPARKTKLHLYYVVDDSLAVAKVVAVWSQYRSGPPRL
jgi:hypothetical protein